MHYETMSALRLGSSDTWHQVFTDGTARRQIEIQNLVVALMEDGHLDAVIVSLCMYVENETSERCVESIVETVSGCCLWCSGEVDVRHLLELRLTSCHRLTLSVSAGLFCRT